MHILLKQGGGALIFCLFEHQRPGFGGQVERAADDHTGKVVFLAVVEGLVQGFRHAGGGFGIQVEAGFLLQGLGREGAGAGGRDGEHFGKAGPWSPYRPACP